MDFCTDAKSRSRDAICRFKSSPGGTRTSEANQTPCYGFRVATDTPVRPAATVVVLRDSRAGPEIFMVRRHHSVAFMAGAHVFPGGRVDAGDHDADPCWCDGISEAARQLSDLPAGVALAYHVAAARELFEEAGVLLARSARAGFVALAGGDAHDRFMKYRHDVHGGRRTLRAVVEEEQLRLALDALVAFAHWVTPPVDTRRFDTRFFVARVPPEQIPAHEPAESTESTWTTAAAALAAAAGGDIVLPPPTWATLRELELFTSVDDVLAWARTRKVVRREPKLVEDADTRMLVLPGDPLSPEYEPVTFETRFRWVEDRWRAERAV
jgi:8-oxo-dGTP pyrophosphatase MutT (NUDIX family)